MTPLEIVYAGLNDVAFGDEDTAAGVVDEHCETFEDVWAVQRALSSVRKAGWQFNQALEKAMIRELKDEAIRMDDYIIRVVPGGAVRKVRDEEGLIEYLSLSAGAMLAFPPHAISLAGLKAFAAQKGDDPEQIIERFFEWSHDEETPPELKINRMEYAPYWALKLKHGERCKAPEKQAVSA